MASFRYLVNDVDLSIAFYTKHLGFAVQQQFGPAMAILTRGDLSLWLAGPMASAAKPMPDGRTPEPVGGIALSWKSRTSRRWPQECARTACRFATRS